MEEILEAINRITALLEQYDYLEDSLAKVEMQREVAYRVPDKELEQIKTQVNQAIKLWSSQKDAADRAIWQITGIDLPELRIRVLDIKVLFSRYSDINLEYVRLQKAFEIIAEASAFDEEEGEGASRKEFEEQLTKLKIQRDITLQNLVKVLNETINKSPIVGATDSVLSKLHNRNLSI